MARRLMRAECCGLAGQLRAKTIYYQWDQALAAATARRMNARMRRTRCRYGTARLKSRRGSHNKLARDAHCLTYGFRSVDLSQKQRD
jgi:hypothetical protein